MQLIRKKGMLDSSRVLFLPVDQISPNPDQPRSVFSPEALDELAQSISALGLLQPLTVRRVGEGWELVAGERRLRAAKLAGLREVPCLSLQLDSRHSSLLALVENLQRRDLDFWEEALALRKLMDQYHLSQEEVARRIGKSQSAVANKLRLLRLPPEILDRLREAGCTERHARALLPLESPDLLQTAVRQVTEQKLTVAQTEALVRGLLTPPPQKRRKPTVFLKDVRLFLNSLNRGLELMNSAGVGAQCQRQDLAGEILLTIRIPNHSPRKCQDTKQMFD